MRKPLLALTLLVIAASPALAAGSEPLTVKLVGQSLIKKDLRVFAPAAVEQAREHLAADVVFTNLEVAVAPKCAAITLRAPDVTQVEPDVLDNLKEMGFNLLALSNNHALDLGIPGLLATMEGAAGARRWCCADRPDRTSRYLTCPDRQPRCYAGARAGGGA